MSSRQLASVSVSVCICTRNRLSSLTACLAAIADSGVVPERVVISDDGADAETVVVPKTLNVTFVTGPQRGLAQNRNRALLEVDTEYVLFLDDDCHLGRSFLETGLQAMAAQEAVFGSGRVIISGSESNGSAIVVAHEQSFLGFQQRPYRDGEPLRSIVINAAIFPRALFDHDLFDPRLRYGYEEVDIASRAVARGFRIVGWPEARNAHYPSPASRDDYAAVVTASRLYATFKRYWWTDQRPVRAMVFAVVGPVHALLAGVRRRRWDLVREAADSIVLAVSYTRSYRETRRSPALTRGE